MKISKIFNLKRRKKIKKNLIFFKNIFETQKQTGSLWFYLYKFLSVFTLKV